MFDVAVSLINKIDTCVIIASCIHGFGDRLQLDGQEVPPRYTPYEEHQAEDSTFEPPLYDEPTDSSDPKCLWKVREAIKIFHTSLRGWTRQYAVKDSDSVRVLLDRVNRVPELNKYIRALKLKSMEQVPAELLFKDLLHILYNEALAGPVFQFNYKL